MLINCFLPPLLASVAPAYAKAQQPAQIARGVSPNQLSMYEIGSAVNTGPNHVVPNMTSSPWPVPILWLISHALIAVPIRQPKRAK